MITEDQIRDALHDDAPFVAPDTADALAQTRSRLRKSQRKRGAALFTSVAALLVAVGIVAVVLSGDDDRRRIETPAQQQSEQDSFDDMLYDWCLHNTASGLAVGGQLGTFRVFDRGAGTGIEMSVELYCRETSQLTPPRGSSLSASFWVANGHVVADYSNANGPVASDEAQQILARERAAAIREREDTKTHAASSFPPLPRSYEVIESNESDLGPWRFAVSESSDEVCGLLQFRRTDDDYTVQKCVARTEIAAPGSFVVARGPRGPGFVIASEDLACLELEQVRGPSRLTSRGTAIEPPRLGMQLFVLVSTGFVAPQDVYRRC